MNLFKFLQGYKTYIVGTAAIAYALLGLWGGLLDIGTASNLAVLGLGLMGVRSGITTALVQILITHGVPLPPNPGTQAIKKAVAVAKNIAPMLALLFVMGIALTGCGTVGSYFDNPQNDLQIAETGFSTALALYESVCNTNAGSSFCTPDNIQQAINLEAAVQAAIKVAQSVLTTANGAPVSSAVIQADINNVVVAVQKFSDFVNSLQVQKASAMRAALLHR